ncbi:MAG: hypothetical protein NZM37_07085, partial [Sandaracinaceae bacterium]|nr:hypothetical protein [Sandaracinaceae bacterium]
MRRLATYVPCLVLLLQASPLQAQGSFDGSTRRLEEALRQKEAEFARVRSEFDALTKEEENLDKRIRMRTHWLQRLSYRIGQRSAAIEAVFAQIALRHRVERILANDLAALQALRKRIGSLRDASARIEKELNELRAQRQQAKENESFWVNLLSGFSGQHPPIGALASIPSRGAISFESQRGSLFQPLLAPRSIREVERIDGAGLE